MMLQDLWNTAATNNGNSIDKPSSTRLSSSAPSSPTTRYIAKTKHCQPFHVANKVPIGDTPYVKAKRVQLVDKDPDKAIALFWAAINAGDRVDSALKDMAIVMKQQNRAEEAIEAIKSLRSRCSDQAQESLDNILLDLYKRCGRLDDQISLLRHKLLLIQQGLAFNGKRTKTARSQGRKFQVSLEQEATRLLGNLGWALMQQESYVEAEEAYRRALLIGPDNNKMCNLGICLMKQGRLTEAKETLKKVKPAISDGPRGVDSHLKAFERAQDMLLDLESKIPFTTTTTTTTWSSKFDAKLTLSQSLSSSSIWKPQPCVDLFSLVRPSKQHQDHVFADENADLNMGFGSGNTIRGKKTPEVAPPPPLSSICSSSMLGNSLRIDAPPFYSKLSNLKGTTATATTATTQVAVMGNRQQKQQGVVIDPLGNLKRSRPSGTNKAFGEEEKRQPLEQRSRGRSLTFEETPMGSPAARWKDMLPDNKAFNEAIVAAVLAPVLEAAQEVAVVEAVEKEGEGCGKNEEWRSPLVERKRLRVFEDITQSINSPRF